MSNIVPATPEAVQQAARVLRRGGLVAFPTETVYGLGADAENPAAVLAMFAAKGRPADHPVIVHLASAALLDDFAATVSPAARTLASTFWPGPLTLVFQRGPRVSELVTGGLATVGLRVPSHPVANALLREFHGPIAAPSANRFGRVSATRPEHVARELSGSVELILDGGGCTVGLESTIVDVSTDRIAVLRPGAVTREQLAQALGQPVELAGVSSPRVSGSLPSHYAPRARVELVPRHEMAARARQLAAGGCPVAVLTPEPSQLQEPQIHVLRIPAAWPELAQSLYAVLRAVDEIPCDVALISLPEEHGLGAAIADRLRRAAGPRGNP